MENEKELPPNLWVTGTEVTDGVYSIVEYYADTIKISGIPAQLYVPCSKLRALVEKWRRLCNGNYNATMCDRCNDADELEALIEPPKGGV